jgi:hypothetical protein
MVSPARRADRRPTVAWLRALHGIGLMLGICPLAAAPSPQYARRTARHGRTGNQRMTDKAFVDAAQPATLNNGGGKLTDYPTLQEAVMAWHRLPPEQTRRATIRIIGGPVYTAIEIARLHYRPKPA